MRRIALTCALLAAAAGIAAAQPPPRPATAFDLALPPPADSGRPLLPALRDGDAPAPGRLQLRGNLDRNGAVELRARVFDW